MLEAHLLGERPLLALRHAPKVEPDANDLGMGIEVRADRAQLGARAVGCRRVLPSVADREQIGHVPLTVGDASLERALSQHAAPRGVVELEELLKGRQRDGGREISRERMCDADTNQKVHSPAADSASFSRTAMASSAAAATPAVNLESHSETACRGSNRSRSFNCLFSPLHLSTSSLSRSLSALTSLRSFSSSSELSALFAATVGGAALGLSPAAQVFELRAESCFSRVKPLTLLDNTQKLCRIQHTTAYNTLLHFRGANQKVYSLSSKWKRQDSR